MSAGYESSTFTARATTGITTALGELLGLLDPPDPSVAIVTP
jgi:hypothetical protein